jgi:hypothetical protein
VRSGGVGERLNSLSHWTAAIGWNGESTDHRFILARRRSCSV